MATYIINDFEKNYPNLIFSGQAKKHGISNTPDSQEIIKNMQYCCKCIIDVLATVAETKNLKVGINSSYRNKKVNELVGGAKQSAHLSGLAIDICFVDHGKENTGYNNMVLYYITLLLIKNKKIKVGQVIYEKGNSSRPDWVHVSYPHKKGETNQILSISNNNKTNHLNLDNELARAKQVNPLCSQFVIN